MPFWGKPTVRESSQRNYANQRLAQKYVSVGNVLQHSLGVGVGVGVGCSLHTSQLL